MGQKTAAQIIDEGLNLAGDTRLSTPAFGWLKTWLASAYAAWPWPFLMRRTTNVTLGTGVTSVSFGAGSTETQVVRRILDPIWVYNSAKTSRARARIRTLVGGQTWEDETVNDTTINRGLPQQFKVRPDTTLYGKWSLIPYPIPDKDYLLAIEYLVIPDALSATSIVPVYPNDRTMVQAIYTEALKYMKEPEYKNALQILAAQVADDRMKYGEVTGINDTVSVDPNVFRY